MAVFQIFKRSTKNEYYYLLKATGNSQLILSGDGFLTRQSCLDAVQFVKSNSENDTSFIRTDNYLSYTFVIRNLEAKVVGKSENYTSEDPREKIVSLIQNDAASAIIQDLT